MLKSKSFLCIDFGAGSLKAAEFELTENSSLCLKKFGVRPMGLEGSSESMRPGVLQRALQELISERGFTAKQLVASVPGFQVFSKYVKLPPVDTSKVTQIIQYEAQQNVPFPLEEVVWDYQITGNTPSGELEVFLVAVKSDIVEGLFKIADACGLRLQLVDAGPSALCNAFRYNYADMEGCSMLLDIGAKTSNVIFFEKNKFSTRGINIGANSITQDFMAEARMPFAKAEAFKIAEGFVSLGGAYEEPENPQQAQISKIARQVMTRLHIQVNQTMQFFRGQQGGSAPQRVYLAGGASIMPYTPQFFSEKLNVPIEYFNPFRTLQIDPSINLEELAKVAHSLGEVVGLGLRNVAQCPIELNLMPKSILKKQQFNSKKPYFIATVASLALGLVAMGWFYDTKIVTAKQDIIGQVQARSAPLQEVWEKKLNPELEQIDQLKKQADQLSAWLEDRTSWCELLKEVRASLLTAENRMETLLRAKGARVGVWIEKMLPDVPGMEEKEVDTSASEGPRNRFAGMTPEMMKRYGLVPTAPEPDPAAAASTVSTNEVVTINLTCAAVNLQKYSDTANLKLMNEFKTQLLSRTNLFAPETELGKSFTPPEATAATFNFEIALKLKRPIKI